MTKLLSLIVQLCAIHNLEPKLVQSVIQVESGWNNNVVGKAGELGLLQVLPQYSNLSIKDLKDPKSNIKEGIKKLAEAKKYCNHQDNNTWLICYNRGIMGGAKVKFPYKDNYYLKVMKELKSL